jgi:hypothetical protein
VNATPEPPIERCTNDDGDGHRCDPTPGRGYLTQIEQSRRSALLWLYNLAVECPYPVCGYQMHPDDAARLAEVCDEAAAEIRGLFDVVRIVPVEQPRPCLALLHFPGNRADWSVVGEFLFEENRDPRQPRPPVKGLASASKLTISCD